MPQLLDRDIIEQIIREFLQSFLQLPGFRRARPGETKPIYDPHGDLAYYEVKFLSEDRLDCGYAIISATEHDLPVVEFSDKGPTHFERFSRRTREPFKMVRFGPTYITAESQEGRLITAIGERPMPVPKGLTIQSRQERTTRYPRSRTDISARKPQRPGLLQAAAFDYDAFKATFQKKAISSAYLRRQWEVARSPNSPCLNNYYGVAKPDILERGRTDEFVFPIPNLGELTQLRVRHDNSGSHPGWFLEDITIRRAYPGKEWTFPCHRWLARDEDDGRIDRILMLSEQVSYRISVRTGDRANAGTDANVYLTLFGANGESAEALLDDPDRDDFERGHTDTFTVQTFDLGNLSKLSIRHDNAGDHAGWFLEDIRVRNDTTGQEWLFPCSRWLARDEDDRRIQRFLTLAVQVNYRISVRTGNRDNAGTDANVFVTLTGANGIDVERQLDDPGRDDFERGDTDSFNIRTFDLGELTQLRIRHDNAGDHPGWFLEDVRVRNEATGREWLFPCSRWLARDEDDHRIERLLTLAPQASYRISVRTGDRDRAGTDANVFLTLTGTNGTEPDTKLDTPEHDDFERGHTDVFTIGTYDLGELTTVHIRHDNTGDHPGWFLEDIRIRNQTSGREWLFLCSRWLARDEDDRRIDRTLTLNPQVNYRISVRTGDVAHAGTDANVSISLFGTDGVELDIPLDDPHRDDFERGQTNVFVVRASNIGNITKLRIRHDNSGDNPGWFLEDIRIRNETTGTEWLFPCHRWLAVDEDDALTDRMLFA